MQKQSHRLDLAALVKREPQRGVPLLAGWLRPQRMQTDQALAIASVLKGGKTGVGSDVVDRSKPFLSGWRRGDAGGQGQGHEP